MARDRLFDEATSAGSARKVGLFLGPCVFALTLLADTPEELSVTGQRVLAVTLWTATWWITEAIPINAAALLPFLLFPVTGVLDAPAAAKASMSDALYLFLGGFFLAAALERWGLHRRLALSALRVLGTSPRRLIGGVMVMVAFLSCWLTNTATTVMMLPILLAVVLQAERVLGKGPESRRFGAALILGTALAANIGGMGTPVGTLPNAVLIGQLQTRGVEITFLEWMGRALPVVCLLLPLAWLVLVLVVARIPRDMKIGEAREVMEQSRSLGRWSPAEIRVGMVFLLAVVLWVTRQDLRLGSGVNIPGWASGLETLGVIPVGAGKGIRDGSVSVIAALLLFLIPAGNGERLLDWERASRVPWGVLFLLMGGFLLAHGFTLDDRSGSSLGSWLGTQLSVFQDLPLFLRLLGIALTVSFLTEFASNTATTTLVVPVLFGLSVTGAEMIPYGFAAALAASCSFMMPVATPPNALAFGTGRIPMKLMIRNGLLLNVSGAAVIALVVWLQS